MENDMYDVLLIDAKTRIVRDVVGERMHRHAGFYSAERWKNTWLARKIPGQEVVICLNGKFRRDDVVPNSEIF